MRGQKHRIDAARAVDGRSSADDRAHPLACARRVVPACHFTSMSPKPRFARCAFSAASARRVMSGTSRRSSFATARCGRMVLPPGPVYPADEPLDVHGRPRHRDLERFAASSQS